MATLSVNTVLGEFRRPNEGFEFQGQLGDVAVVLDADDEHAAAALAQRVSTTVGELAGFARRIAVELANSFSPEGPGEVEVWENDRQRFPVFVTLGAALAGMLMMIVSGYLRAASVERSAYTNRSICDTVGFRPRGPR